MHMRVSKNAYYHWLKVVPKKQQKLSLIYLKQRIETLFFESNEVYGSVRIQKSLEREGLLYSRSYISLLMKELGLKSVLRKKYVITTDSNHSFPIAENKLNREFTSLVIGEKWVSDITYIKVGNTWNYLTTILDLADRKIVSWVLSEDMKAENTVIKAWNKAITVRKVTDNHIFHSDRGVQYTCDEARTLFHGITKYTQSMSRKGNCWDNAVAESFFKTIKYECLNRYSFKCYTNLYDCIDNYIKWYNTKRLHSSLGYLTPIEMELKIRINKYNNVA